MSTTPNGEPATKADLRSMEERFDQRMVQLEEKLIETMRDMKLRGFAAHNSSLTVRMRKLEADQNNLDAATSPRLALLEQQITEMNIRLMKVEGARLQRGCHSQVQCSALSRSFCAAISSSRLRIARCSRSMLAAHRQAMTMSTTGAKRNRS